MKKNNFIISFAAIALLAAATMLFYQSKHKRPSIHAVFSHPGGKMRLVIERQSPSWLSSAMPGQGSDVPGIAKLVNENDKILDQRDIEMVQLVDGVQWRSDRVTIMPGLDLLYAGPQK